MTSSRISLALTCVLLAVAFSAQANDPVAGIIGKRQPTEILRMMPSGTSILQQMAGLTFIAGSRDDMGGELYEPGARAGRYCEAERWLQTPVAGRPLAVGSGDPAVSAADGLELALSAVSAAGVRLLAAVELTRPEIGVPVFRVVAAGLEGPSDAPDYVPGHRARRAGAR